MRIIGDAENPRFCLPDLCRILGLDASQVMKRLDSGVVSIHPIADALERIRDTNFVNEDGLYDVILDSRKPAARRFRKWVTSKVLPAIRKTGVYMTTAAAEKILLNPDFIIQLAQQVKDAQAKIALLQPKADFCDNVLLSDEHLTSELIAKEYGHSSIWLHQILIRYDIIFKRGRRIYLKAKYANLGYRISETVILEGGKTVVNHFWTQKGRHFIYNFLKSKGIVPIRERSEIISDLF